MDLIQKLAQGNICTLKHKQLNRYPYQISVSIYCHQQFTHHAHSLIEWTGQWNNFEDELEQTLVLMTRICVSELGRHPLQIMNHHLLSIMQLPKTGYCQTEETSMKLNEQTSHYEMSSAVWQLFCSIFNVLIPTTPYYMWLCLPPDSLRVVEEMWSPLPELLLFLNYSKMTRGSCGFFFWFFL